MRSRKEWNQVTIAHFFWDILLELLYSHVLEEYDHTFFKNSREYRGTYCSELDARCRNNRCLFTELYTPGGGTITVPGLSLTKCSINNQ